MAWSDPKRWWMDLLKSALGYFVGVLFTILVLWALEDSRQQRQFVWQAERSVQLTAIADFGKAIRIYSSWSYDAVRERLCGGTRGSGTIAKWQDDGYDVIDSSTRLLKRSFPKISDDMWHQLDDAKSQIYHVFNAVVPLSDGCPQKDQTWVPRWNEVKASLTPARRKFDQAAEAITVALYENWTPTRK